MSSAHPFLSFTSVPLKNGSLLREWGLCAEQWQQKLQTRNEEVNSSPPPALASATVLSQILGVIAATGVFGAAAAPAVVDVGVDALAFEVGPHLLPVRIQVTSARPGPDDPARRLRAARAAFETVAEPLARALPTLAHFGQHQRGSMARDAWRLALRDARGIIGGPPVVQRESCCYLYTIPGTTLCAGCPRAGRPERPAPPDRQDRP